MPTCRSACRGHANHPAVIGCIAADAFYPPFNRFGQRRGVVGGKRLWPVCQRLDSQLAQPSAASSGVAGRTTMFLDPHDTPRLASHLLNDLALSPERRSARIPTMRISSSKFIQWIYLPSPMISKLAHTFSIRYQRQGYQASGAPNLPPPIREFQHQHLCAYLAFLCTRFFNLKYHSTHASTPRVIIANLHDHDRNSPLHIR